MRWLTAVLYKLRRTAAQDDSAARDAPLAASDDAFEDFLNALATVDEPQRAALPLWTKDVLAFGRFMSDVAEDGVLVALSNNWTDRSELVEALRRIGEPEIARLVDDAVEMTLRHGEADGLRCHVELAMDDEVVSDAFSKAETSIEDRWEEMWVGAQRYAADHGWSPETAAAP